MRLIRECEVDFLPLQHAHKLLHGLKARIEVYVRVAAREVEHSLAEDGAKRMGAPNVKLALVKVLYIRDAVYALLSLLQRLAGVGEEITSLLGQRDAVAVADQERAPELILERADLLRERALADEKLPRRLCEIEQFADLDEIFELPEFQFSP